MTSYNQDNNRKTSAHESNNDILQNKQTEQNSANDRRPKRSLKLKMHTLRKLLKSSLQMKKKSKWRQIKKLSLISKLV